MPNFVWNPVYNLVVKIKKDFIDKYKYISYEEVYINNEKYTCLEYWIHKLNIDIYNKIFKILQINQYGSYLLIRYGKYSDIYKADDDITNENIWDLYDGFYRECRSVVIDIKNEEIVISPFRKFRNLNEGEENNIENVRKRIDSARSIEITNKLDGSMQSARFYHNNIIMTGSQSLDQNQSWRLSEGYNMLISNHNYISMVKENEKYTFIFEFISLKDAHIVKYEKKDEGLYLIGMRNVYSGEQLSYKEAKSFSEKYNVLMTQIYNFSFDDIFEHIKNLKSDVFEGFVVNIDGFMLKIKGDDYIKVHKIISQTISPNAIIKCIADDNIDDFIAKVPSNYKLEVLNIVNKILSYLSVIKYKTNKYYQDSPKDNKVDFMKYVENNVPKLYRCYVRNIYLGKQNNFLKTNSSNPHYRTLSELEEYVRTI